MEDKSYALDWKPTKEQLEAYKAREVELCVKSLQKNPDLKQSHTLYSLRTWDLAYAQVKRKS